MSPQIPTSDEPRYISDQPPEPGTERLHRTVPPGEPTDEEYLRAQPAMQAGLPIEGDAAGEALGIDIYGRYQDWTDPSATARRGIRFVIIKASDGGGRAYAPADNLVRAGRSAAGAFQLGLYHYAQPTPSPETQADVLIAEVRRLGAADLWPVLDLEGTFQTMPVADATAFARRFLERVRAAFGGAMLYANSYLLGRLNVDGWGLPWLRVWAANYGANDGYRHALPVRWAGAAAHQFTDKLVVPGIAGYVDGDYTRDLGLIITQGQVSTLVIQMGHVGRPPCPGSSGTAGEQDFTQRAGQACARLLNRDGWVVRVIDADPNYSAHPQLGGNPDYYRGDAFVAVHADGSTDTARDGASFGYRNDPGRDLAERIKAAYLRRTGRPEIWPEPDNYTDALHYYYGTGVAINVGSPRAVIMECGFLTNDTDRAMLLAPSGPDNVALAIGEALGIGEDPDMVAPTARENAIAVLDAPLDAGAPDTSSLADAARKIHWGVLAADVWTTGAAVEALAAQARIEAKLDLVTGEIDKNAVALLAAIRAQPGLTPEQHAEILRRLLPPAILDALHALLASPPPTPALPE